MACTNGIPSRQQQEQETWFQCRLLSSHNKTVALLINCVPLMSDPSVPQNVSYVQTGLT